MYFVWGVYFVPLPLFCLSTYTIDVRYKQLLCTPVREVAPELPKAPR